MKGFSLIITGGFGSGKSQALKYFKQLGAAAFSCDDIARDLTSDARAGTVQRMAKILGRGILDSKGRLRRRAAGRVMFGNPVKRRQIESFLHPLILKTLRRQIRGAHAAVKVIEIPLFFEAMKKGGILSDNKKVNLRIPFDASIAVWAKKKTILRRLSRQGWPIKEIVQRIGSQMSVQSKCCKSDFILDNNGSRLGLLRQVKKIYQTCSIILKDYRKRKHAGN